MFRKILAMSASLVLVMGFSTASVAADGAEAPAKVIVYRADESLKTDRLSMNLNVDSMTEGRLHAEKAVVITRPAGEYVLDTNIRGAKGLVMDLAPGQTYYVHAKMKMRGTSLRVALEEVEEQVALGQAPTLGEAI